MRIRRRPQAQALLLPSLLHPPPSASDPSTAPPPPNAPRNQDPYWLSGGSAKEETNRLQQLHLHHHPNADLDSPPPPPRRAALPLFPQGNVAVGCSRSPGGATAAAMQGAPDGHRSSQGKAGERDLANGVRAMPVAATVDVNVKEEGKNDGGGVKKRRAAAVLMEGSRCSRVNGRGWRCSQPTLVGYSLCEHHLGKGRMRSVAAGRGGAAQLGRTESRKNAAVVTTPTESRKNAAAVTTPTEPASVRP